MLVLGLAPLAIVAYAIGVAIIGGGIITATKCDPNKAVSDTAKEAANAAIKYTVIGGGILAGLYFYGDKLKRKIW